MLTRKSYATAACAIALVMLGGCASRYATHGNQLEPEVLARVVPGQTRLDEVEALFGKPSARGAFNSGRVYYISQHMETRPGGRKQTISRKIVIFSYNADGIVTAIDIADETAGQSVTHVEATTPVPGNTFGVVDQILTNVKRRRSTAPRDP